MKMITLLKAVNISGKQVEFTGVSQACEYLKNHNLTGSDTTETIKESISKAIKRNKWCYGFIWDYIETEDIPEEPILTDKPIYNRNFK